MAKQLTADTPTAANQPETLGVLWGAQAIAAFVERPVRDTYYLLQQKLLDADKIGDVWVTTRNRLRRQFEDGVAPSPKSATPNDERARPR